MQAGYELPIEVTRAQLTAAQVEQRTAQLEDQEETAADQLRLLLGLEPDQPIEVSAENIPPAADQTISNLVAEALRNNPEVKVAESERVASEERLRGERGGYWPTIGLIGQYNLLAKFNNYDQFFNKFQRNNFIVGIDVKIPIFASHTGASVSFAQANLTASQMQVENKRAQVSLDVRHQARQAREMDMNREVARLQLELAQQNLQVLQSQFQQGRASIRDLEAGQLDENEKWLAFLDAEYAHQQSELDLLRTTGQLAQAFQ
jgi:outer membrane protein TolC